VGCDGRNEIEGSQEKEKLVPFISSVNASFQTSVPSEVCEMLGLNPGDFLRYMQTADGIVIDRAPAASDSDPFETFGDWDKPEENHAWKDL
jgi:antitoxin PrlF